MPKDESNSCKGDKNGENLLLQLFFVCYIITMLICGKIYVNYDMR